MWIFEALRGVEVIERTSTTADVTGVQYDSRRVKAGDLFVAIRGLSSDGNAFIEGAIARGARVVLTDDRTAWVRARAAHPKTVIDLVANSRRALARVAANLFDQPQQKLAICAVTGTNGKTTTAWLLEQMLRSVGRRCMLLGTIETHIGEAVRASERTTPESRDLLELFAEGVRAGATEAVMEISSHALDQERVWGVHVDTAIFTNLTQDHLDYHGTMEAYFAAKARLFAGVGAAPPRVAVLNADDAGGGARLLGSELQSQIYSYGIDAGDFRAENVSIGIGRTSFVWRMPSGSIALHSPLTGRVNVYNLLAAACAAHARGLSLDEIAHAAERLEQVPGRFQMVPAGEQGFTVIIDYAHTDDALRNLLALARELVEPQEGRVITLFGCGGDRDRAKRPLMGRAAGEGSDLVILTSDNPRSEDPAAILADALAGLRETTAEVLVESDRAAAIGLAIHAARPHDIVLLAGKGHERLQTLASGSVSFDDAAVAAQVLEEME